MLPKGIIFDLDNTIIAFDAVANSAGQYKFEYYPSAHPERTLILIINKPCGTIAPRAL